MKVIKKLINSSRSQDQALSSSALEISHLAIRQPGVKICDKTCHRFTGLAHSNSYHFKLFNV